MVHPLLHVSLLWITGDWQSCPLHSATSVSTGTSRLYHPGRSPSLVFLFLRQWSSTFRKFSGNKKNTGGKFTPICSREALCSPLELSSTAFLFSQDSSVVAMGFNEIPRLQLGGTGLGTEQRYFRDLATMTCDNCRALCTIKLLPVAHVLVNTWMLTVKPVYKLLNESDYLKWTTNTQVTQFSLTFKA